MVQAVTSETTGAAVPSFLLHAPEAVQWFRVPEAALRIGCTERWLRMWLHGEAGGPALESQMIRGHPYVQPAIAYDHVRQFARRGAPGLHPPPGYVQNPQPFLSLEFPAAKVAQPGYPGKDSESGGLGLLGGNAADRPPRADRGQATGNVVECLNRPTALPPASSTINKEKLAARGEERQRYSGAVSPAAAERGVQKIPATPAGTMVGPAKLPFLEQPHSSAADHQAGAVDGVRVTAAGHQAHVPAAGGVVASAQNEKE